MSSRLRPFVLMNYALSIDGKISTDQRDPTRFPSSVDRKMMQEIRADADAVLIGAGTLRAEDPPLRIRSKERIEYRIMLGKTPHPTFIVLTRNQQIPLEGRFWRGTDIERIVVKPEDTSCVLESALEGKADIIRVGQGSVNIAALCEILFERGLRRLLVEGGGEVNMSFLRAGVVDEIYITFCPYLIGGGNAPTPADGMGFAADDLRKVRLMESRQVGQEFFFRYQIVR